MMLQLNPSYPVICPQGKGEAIMVTNYGREHHLEWTIVLDKDGSFWSYPNTEVKMQWNISIGRVPITSDCTQKI